ncbi:CTI6 [Candida jiufengensis]|uniref:CTI6 n=1 Tax=Candida jiufengensis TaxID=497108 RepID=UPI002225508D|nr:CTI6 [Candida jiufengensis]KAI5956988.1 CTI6 [Candida jiufengensis]
MSRRSGRRSINLESKNSSEVELDDNNFDTKNSTRGTRSNDNVEEEEEIERDNGEVEEDENQNNNNDSSIEDEEEVTRCICGQDELHSELINPNLITFLKKEYRITIDQGLFIQCEECGVWQHGYCVGLYENEDVPDKYWCEQCKPENHTLISDPYSKRTLYKPVNDKRKKLEQFGSEESKDLKSNLTTTTTLDEDNNENSKYNKRKRTDKVSPPAQPKHKRKERSHHHNHIEEDIYDKQLQKALRESAKESGIVIDESDADSLSPRKRNSRAASLNSSSNNQELPKKLKKEPNTSNNEEDDEVELESTTTTTKTNTNPPITSGRRKPDYKKSKNKISKKKRDLNSSSSSQSSNQDVNQANTTTNTTTTSNSSSSNPSSSSFTINKDEIIQLPYKPRYVSQKSSIYDLRKRTSAIIEWISRTKQDLIEERKYKFELYSFTPDSEEILKEKNLFELKYNEKSDLIDNLSSKINDWEVQFGKYAP